MSMHCPPYPYIICNRVEKQRVVASIVRSEDRSRTNFGLSDLGLSETYNLSETRGNVVKALDDNVAKLKAKQTEGRATRRAM
jgi:hypothetical protein